MQIVSPAPFDRLPKIGGTVLVGLSSAYRPAYRTNLVAPPLGSVETSVETCRNRRRVA